MNISTATRALNHLHRTTIESFKATDPRINGTADAEAINAWLEAIYEVETTGAPGLTYLVTKTEDGTYDRPQIHFSTHLMELGHIETVTLEQVQTWVAKSIEIAESRIHLARAMMEA